MDKAKKKHTMDYRPESPNYVGNDAIQNAIATFNKEGFELTTDGALSAKLLNNLAGRAHGCYIYSGPNVAAWMRR